jgi:hypothetical protein
VLSQEFNGPIVGRHQNETVAKRMATDMRDNGENFKTARRLSKAEQSPMAAS